MWKLRLICLALIISVMSTDAAKRYRRYRKRQAGGYAGASAGGYAGGYAGGNGGYTGSYTGDYNNGGFGGSGFDYAPEFGTGFIDPYLFHQQLTAQILAQHAAQTNAIITTSSTGNGQAWGSASVQPSVDMYWPNDLLPPENTAIQSQIGNQAYYGNKPHRYAPNYAAASGSVGPGGYYQSAYVSPAGTSPNIVNRFGASSPGGYKGVSVSSFSTSSDVNGKRTGYRGAQTTINDNGKVTTYNVHS